MKICVVYQYFQNQSQPGHSLVYEMSQHFADAGHDVSVISGDSGYMSRAGAPRQVQRGAWRLWRRETEGRVQVLRASSYARLHGSYLGRLVSFLTFTVSSALTLLLLPRPDVVLASSPPLFPVFSAALVCRLRRIPIVVEIRDLWPASAVELNIVRNRLLIGAMAWMERVVYDGAAEIVALTEGIRADIVARGWPQDRVALVTCGVDATVLYPDAAAAGQVRDAQGWQGKRIALYFGALGAANNIPVILRAAAALRERTDIGFVLVGDGMMRADIEAQIRQHGLANVVLLPPVPKSEARAYLSAADMCIVTLQDIPLFSGAIPTKLIDYMACGKPVLCGLRGEAALIVERTGCGVIFEPDDHEALARAVAAFADDEQLRETCGARGPAFVAQNFSAVTMRERLLGVLGKAADSARGTARPRAWL